MASLPSRSTRFPGLSCSKTFESGNKLLLRLVENPHSLKLSHIAFGEKIDDDRTGMLDRKDYKNVNVIRATS
jgi:hypothetical protein